MRRERILSFRIFCIIWRCEAIVLRLRTRLRKGCEVNFTGARNAEQGLHFEFSRVSSRLSLIGGSSEFG